MRRLSASDDLLASKLIKREAAHTYYDRSSISSKAQAQFYEDISQYRASAGATLSTEDVRLANDKARSLSHAIVFAGISRLFGDGVKQAAANLHLDS